MTQSPHRPSSQRVYSLPRPVPPSIASLLIQALLLASCIEVAQVALRLPPQDALPLAVLRQHLDHPSLTYDPAWMVERDLLLARIDTAEGRPAAAHRRLEEAHRRSLDLGLHHAAGRIQDVLDARSANLNPKEQPLR